ncbi:hypothetical protein SUDANB1_03486 [Streptomyces sp. enrichment culture]
MSERAEGRPRQRETALGASRDQPSFDTSRTAPLSALVAIAA